MQIWGADAVAPPHPHPPLMFSSPPQAWRSVAPWIRPRLGGTTTPPDPQKKGSRPPPALSTPHIWHLGGETRSLSAPRPHLPHIALRCPPPPHIHPPKCPHITCREGGTRSPPPPWIPPPAAALNPSTPCREGGTGSPPAPQIHPPHPPHITREGGSSPTSPPLSSPLPPQICPGGGNGCPPAAPRPPPHLSQPLPGCHWDPQGWEVLGGFGGLPPPHRVSVSLGGSWRSSPPPPTSPPPNMEELPHESGQEPPPDPPAGTHG